jgi:predicted nucleic acid-binding protein
MLVIADSSPLIVLANIGAIEVLPSLFGQVTIPPQVAAELSQGNRPKVVQDLIANKPAWLNVQSPSVNEQIPLLQEGEIAAINLAREMKADLLLIDEIEGRKAAAARKIPLTGTIGVLEMAAKANLLDLKEAFEKVKQTDFWISPKLLDERLKIYQRR